MSWRALPPAGNPIAFAAGCDVDLPVFEGYRACWVNSGTAALALSLIAARRRQPHIEYPEVVLPGYGCPDLVAAAVFAGVRPVLADVQATDPSYDLQSLQSALSPQTVAVVAVNFLGICERLTQLRELLSTWPSALLIEDDAQWFPEPYPKSDLHGDMVCLSFGRGKPVSLLGGGVLLIRDGLDLPDVSDVVQSASDVSTTYFVKVLIYNLLLSPWIYGLVSRLPFLKVGVTTLKSLQSIYALDNRRLKLLSANIRAYLKRSQTNSQAVSAGVPLGVIDLAAACSERSGRLLRYPVLFQTREIRNRQWRRLQSAGLGATAMYQSVLPEIAGVTELVTLRGALTGATQLADRLLTLPVHSGVRNRDLAAIEKILADSV